ncbi:hypothetical protein KM043_001618 [Ampulex compressa]|nr:hypothetical protein KM043_001618 [Ampulex compressa]
MRERRDTEGALPNAIHFEAPLRPRLLATASTLHLADLPEKSRRGKGRSRPVEINEYANNLEFDLERSIGVARGHLELQDRQWLSPTHPSDLRQRRARIPFSTDAHFAELRHTREEATRTRPVLVGPDERRPDESREQLVDSSPIQAPSLARCGKDESRSSEADRAASIRAHATAPVFLGQKPVGGCGLEEYAGLGESKAASLYLFAFLAREREPREVRTNRIRHFLVKIVPKIKIAIKRPIRRYSDVLLFPEEGWARSASSSYWTLTPFWWSRSRCKVVEVAGTRRYSTQAKMVDTGTGTLYIIGSFKRMTTDPDFKLYLTSNVSPSDFNMGYSMTGTLERGCKKTNSFQMTHFAVIRRRDYEKAYEDPNPT